MGLRDIASWVESTTPSLALCAKQHAPSCGASKHAAIEGGQERMKNLYILHLKKLRYDLLI